MSDLKQSITQAIRLHDRNRRRQVLGATLAMLSVVLTVVFALMPAFTQQKKAHCGEEEHIHTQTCYERVLVCGQEEGSTIQTGPTEAVARSAIGGEGTGNIVASADGGDDGDADVDPILEVGDAVESHTHTDDCYKLMLTCGLTEHEHTLACYSDPEADVEDAKAWMRTIPDPDKDMSTLDYLVSIARSQVGYAESTANYEVDEDGLLHGYTRYGAWAGKPYAEWDALLLGFVLHYAGVPEGAYAEDAGAEQWLDLAKKADAYREAGSSYVPQVGDVAFLVNTSGGDTKMRVALVCDVSEERAEFSVVEGDVDGRVCQSVYELDGEDLVGFVEGPQEVLEQPAQMSDELREAEKEDEPVTVVDDSEADAAGRDEESAQAVDHDFIIVADVDGYHIEADVSVLPEGAYTLEVKPIAPTAKQLTAVEQSLSEDMGDGITKQAHVSKKDVKAFDISIRNEAGGEIEVDESVRITVTPPTKTKPQAELETPEVMHLEGKKAERLKTEAEDDGFAFTAEGFSPFVFVYTVDFAYEGYTWSIPGGSGTWLSTVLEKLGGSVNIADVTGAEFSNPELVEVMPDEDEHDWLLRSVKPFQTEETLTLVLVAGDSVVIAVTDEGESVQMLNPLDDGSHSFLESVEFTETDGTLVGATNSPDTMVVRVGHEYYMKLVFAEDELDGDKQFAETGVMRFAIPTDVHLPALSEGTVSTFDIVLDRKHTLKNNTATYHNPTDKYPGGYIDIAWNSADKKNFKLLNASPRARFSLTYIITTLTVPDGGIITFSNNVTLSVEEDPNYEVAVEKEATPHAGNENLIDYTVTVSAEGNAKDIAVSDTMGEALTFQQGENCVQITYVNANGEDVSGTYPSDNVQELTTSETGFNFKLTQLKDGHTARITYSAEVDYKALGGKNMIKETSKNTVTVTDPEGAVLAEDTQTLDDKINYLQLSKYVGNFNPYLEGESAENWTELTLPYEVVYNADQKIDVEGATLKDTIWKGAKSTTTYDTSGPFIVKAYEQRGTVDESTGKFTPAPGDEGIVIQDGWEGVTVTDYRKKSGDELADTLSSWEWTIPEKATHNLDEGKQYTYVIEYQAKVKNEGRESGYIGNQAEEDFAGITRDRPKILPGVGEGQAGTAVDKVHLADDYVAGANGQPDRVYSKWQISFKRKSFALERVQVEETMPHIEIEDAKTGKTRTLADTFVNETSGDHAWSVEGIAGSEQCKPAVSSDQYDVVFWFYKNYVGEDSPLNDEGLYGTNKGNEYEEDITITFWTLNSPDWINETARGKAPTEHWNKVHLVQDAWEADDKEYAVPQSTPTLKKTVKQVGTQKQNVNGVEVEMPVYRYTLTLTGMSDKTFEQRGNEYHLKLTDSFDSTLKYLSPEDAQALGVNADSDWHLMRTIPGADSPTSPVRWEASIAERDQGDQTSSTKQLDISCAFDDLDVLKYNVKDEEGNPLEDEDHQPVRVFGQAYEVSYYLALDAEKILGLAQDLVDNKDAASPATDTVRAFSNTATWESVDESFDTKPSHSAVVKYDLNPIGKKLTYDKDSELASYTIVVNPLKLKITEDGSRYKLEDQYENMAVDFQTVSIVTDPEVDPDQPIEWSFHNNKGTFWIPDETKVTITYEGWPIGSRGTKVNFENTARIDGFEDKTRDEATLHADHEGTASTYHVRIFKFADDNMDVKIPCAVFQLFENDEHGNMVPVHYVNASNNPADDDPAWNEPGLLQRARDANITVDGRLPTPEIHEAGDPVYFITSGGEGDYEGQTGFADIMLSQSRDGVSLKMNKQYYLREVLVPEGYLKEDLDWRFIIGENDDWDHYVYADDSILQVSNASQERALTLHKVFSDRTRGQQIADRDTGYDNYQKDVEFEVIGRDTQGGIIYRKTVTYDDFMLVDTPTEDGTQREYLMILKSLQPGTYTVREKSASVKTPADVTATTLVDGTITTMPQGSAGDDSENQVSEEDLTPSDEGDDKGFTFAIDSNNKTSVDATFTNIYTDEQTTSLTIQKQWNNGGKESFSAKSVEFELYADGVRYDKLTPAEGANENGNLVLTTADMVGEDSMSWSKTISNLPQRNASGDDIVWTIKEIKATYRMGDEEKDFVASGDDLNEHFQVETTGNAAEGYRVTNTLNGLINVKVTKQWSDEELESVDHNDDVVYVDLYRTRANIPSDVDYQELAQAEGTEQVAKNYELNRGNNWTYENQFLEKFDADENSLYHYFAIERSVAGYTTEYAITSEDNHNQQIAITNTPIDGDSRGGLTINKVVDGPQNSDKRYKFTLWNSGKYLHEDGSLTKEKYEFDVAAGQTIEFSNVPFGTYILTEDDEAAQIGGYELSAVTVAIDGETAVDVKDVGLATEVTVDETSAASGEGEVAVVVTNQYRQTEMPKTDVTFGKLWVIPDTEKTDTLPWPDDTQITVKLRRRLKGTQSASGEGGASTADDEFAYTYTIVKNGDALVATPTDTNAPAISVETEAYNVTHYHQYLFTVKDVDQYDGNGNEYEYFVTEEAVTDAACNGLVGKDFVTQYGCVDGIGARVIEGQEDAVASAGADSVECVINRLDITQDISIPVQKVISGRFDYGTGTEEDPFHGMPPFTFKLYDGMGRAVQVGTPPHDVEAISDGQGCVQFDITQLIDLNSMKWWSDEQVLTGTYTFWVKEENPYGHGQLVPMEYNGISFSGYSQKVSFSVRYDWKTGEFAFVNAGEDVETATPQLSEVEVVNPYDPGETKLTIRKHWDDDNNRDGYRTPAKFEVSAYYYDGETRKPLDEVWFLTNDGTAKDEIALPKTVEVGTKTDDSTTVTLPKFYEGHLVYYEVAEKLDQSVIPEAQTGEEGVTLADKYQRSVSEAGHHYANTHDPETINVSVDKLWAGKTDNDVTVKVRLKATYGGKEVTYNSIDDNSPWKEYKNCFEAGEITLSKNGENKWTHMWSALPRFAPGKHGVKVEYVVEELASSIPLGYFQVTSDDSDIKSESSAEPDGTAENVIKNKYEKLNIPLKKIWEDDNDRDGLRPTSVTYQLAAKTEDGSITIPSNDFTDYSGDRVEAAKTLNGDNTTAEWTSAGWVGLPKYYHGKEITYTVTEQELTPPAGFDSANGKVYYNTSRTVVDGDGNTVITNTHPVERTEVKLTKTWIDNTNQDGKRPSIEQFVRNFIHFYAKEGESGAEKEYVLGDTAVQNTTDTYYLYEKTGNTIAAEPYEVDGAKVLAVLSGSHQHGTVGDQYYVTYKNLPVHVSGTTLFVYRVTETDAQGNVLVSGTSDNEYHHLSSLKPSGGPDCSGYYVTANMNETAGANGPEFAITNTYEPDTIDVQANKSWVRVDGHELTSGEIAQLNGDIQLRLVAKVNGNVVDMTEWANLSGHPYSIENPKTLGAEGTATWENVPMYDPAGVQQPITYSIEEVGTSIPDGYHTTSADTVNAAAMEEHATGSIGVTNTYEDVTVTATKNWNDENNQDGLRKPVKFKLQKRIGETGEFSDIADGELSGITSAGSVMDIGVLATDDPGHTATWTNLPAWKNNTRVYYRVVEVTDTGDNELVGYTTNEGAFSNPTDPSTEDGQPKYAVADSITNTHTPQSKTATFTKVWDHKGASNTLTTEQYKQTLHLWARVGAGDPKEVENSAKTTVTTDSVTSEEWFTTNWQAHTTVTKATDADSFTVAITDLPTNRPRNTATADAKPLEYFITEAEVPAGTAGAEAINELLGYYNATYPTGSEGSNHPANKVGEGEQLVNTRQTGSLKIGKEVVSDLSADATKPFTFTITSNPKVVGTGYVTTKTSDGSATEETGTIDFDDQGKATVQLKHGEHIEISGLPIGITYTVTETQETDFKTPQSRIGSAEYAEGDSCACSIATENATVEADFKNIRKVNDLAISKTVHSTVQVDKTREYRFMVTLSDTTISKDYEAVLSTAGEPETTTSSVTFSNGIATIDIKHGQTLTIKDLPVTVGYTVEEVFTEADALKYAAVQQQSGTVAAATASAHNFTNARNTGELTLTKALENAIPDDDGDAFYFDVELKGDDGAKLVLDNNAQIKVDDTVVATVASPKEHELYYDADAGVIKNVPVVWHTATQTAPAGGTVTITGLPYGTTYRVQEVARTTTTTVSNLDMDTSTESGTISGTASNEGFTNTRKIGDLKITKRIESPVIDERNASYDIVVTLKTTKGEVVVKGISATLTRDPAPTSGTNSQPLTFANGSETISIAKNETVTITGIPTDVTYTVTEPDYGVYFTKTFAVKESEAFADTKKQEASGPVVNGAPAETQVTNTRKTGDLSVTKSVVSAVDADKEHEFHYTVVLTPPAGTVGSPVIESKQYGTGGMSFADNTATFDLANGQSKTATGLPTGWTYTVTESDDDSDYLGKFTYSWTKTVGSGNGGTASGDTLGVPASTGITYAIATDPTTVAYTNTRKTGKLKLAKNVKSPFDSENAAHYTLTVNLQMPAESGQKILNNHMITTNYDTETDGSKPTITVAADGTATIAARVKEGKPLEVSGLPIDVQYSVTEENPNASIFEEPVITYQGLTSDAGDDESAHADTSHSIATDGEYGVEVTNARKEVPVKILKVSSLGINKTLDGAEFTMTPVEKEGKRPNVTWSAIHLVSKNGGVFTVSSVESTDADASPAVGANLFNLPPGTYQLVETKAPDGYNTLTAPLTFEVSPDNSKGIINYVDSVFGQKDELIQVSDPVTGDKLVTLRVGNDAGVELPASGGRGTYGYYLLGALLVGIASAFHHRRLLSGLKRHL